ncbi:uncharacterized protein LOC114309968 [Camellia sinensis]|uniref:uncharacterized protein LOC114309968 n=1 Tax=Camellia sinensis TaxID=4442 RepID=UPI001035AD5A|nr:uncharacterized protein LOC114309968 [Camellia sinensis]
MSPEVIQKVKEKTARLLKESFIRIAKYVEWMSNIVPVIKKNGKLRLKNEEDFRWTTEYQAAFEGIKAYLAKPPVLMQPRKNRPLKLYIAATEESLGVFLAQDNEEDLVKHMLSKLILRGRIGKWILALSEFHLEYVPQKAVKRQVLANFLADHPCQSEYQETMELELIILVGIGVVIKSPQGVKTTHDFRVDEITCFNNQAEYEALIMGMRYSLVYRLMLLIYFGDSQFEDSQLVINQVKGIFKYQSASTFPYYVAAVHLLSHFQVAI